MKRILIVFLLIVTYFYSEASGYLADKIKKIDLFIELNQLDSASNYLNEIGKQIKTEKNSISQLAYYDRSALVQKHKGNYKSILAYYDSISQIISSIKPTTKADSMLVARGYFCAGTFLSDKNKNVESVDLFQKAIQYSESVPDNKIRSYYYQNIGQTYLKIGQVEKGLFNVNKAFGIYDVNKDFIGKFGCVNYIANTMVDYRNFELARKYFDIALTLKDSAKDEYVNANLFNDIGRMYNYEMKFDSSLIYFDKALTEANSKKNSYLIAIAETNIGEVLMKQGNYNKAISYLTSALPKFDSIRLDLGVFQTKHLIAFCEFKKHDFKKSEFFQNQAEQLMLKTEIYPNLLIDFYKRSYELKKGTGNIKESLAYLEKFQCMQDSLNGILTNWKINEIESRLLTSVKEKQLAQRNSELQKHKFIIWIIISLFLLAVISTIIISLYIRKRRDAQYQKQLANITILRMQNIRNALSPHFVFNVLNNIWAIIDDREHARAQFDNLINLIRRSLINTEKLAIPLNDEIDFVQSFIELQKLRMDNNLKVEWNIEDGIALSQMVPGMILQIPVENAIKHGLAPKKDNKVLQIDIKKKSGFLQFIIVDNGAGLQQTLSPTKGTGTGLKVLTNTIHILNQINDNKMSYEISNRDVEDGPGTKVIIKIPLQYNYNLY